VAYESVFEKFEAMGQDGIARPVVFKKAGVLSSGDRPELYFFGLDARSVIVCISGGGLAGWQNENRYLSRDEKIDVAGLFLKRKIEAGAELVPEDLRIERGQLESLLRELGIHK
jgi:hypothetical protein